MTYWTRTASFLDVSAFILCCLLWAVGGWLVARHMFSLHSRERIAVGGSAGLLLFIVAGNALANLLPVPLAFWSGAFLVFIVGLGSAHLSRIRPLFCLDDLKAWPTLASIGLIFLLFTFILRGLGIFDDYLHLPLVSLMAAGDIPPHFYANPDSSFAYHYGLQFLSAAMVRIGGFFPWSAWDMARACALSLTAALSWLWIRRLTRSPWAAYAGATLAVFGGGTRWVLLFLPSSWLIQLGAHLELQPSLVLAGPDFYTAMLSPWPVDGGSPLQLPFAFANGLYIPLNYLLGSTGAMPALTILVILLLGSRARLRSTEAVVFGLLLASLALTAEHLYILTIVALAMALGTEVLRRLRKGGFPPKETLYPWLLVSGLSILLSLLQGGFITEGAKTFVSRLQGLSVSAAANYYGFALRWPPGLMSGHLGPLSLLDFHQAVILVAELGPALLLLPLLAAHWLRRMPSTPRWPTILAWASLLSLLFPILVKYVVDRSTTRFPATALWLWTVLGFPVLWLALKDSRPLWRMCSAAAFFAAILGGLVMFSVELAAIPHPQISYFIVPEEAPISRRYWNRLGDGALVIDTQPERAVTLFGRPVRARQDIYIPLAGWEALVADPDPLTMAQAGYRYVYLDDSWWNRLTAQQQQTLTQPCVTLVDSVEVEASGFRKLLDVSNCRYSIARPLWRANWCWMGGRESCVEAS